MRRRTLIAITGLVFCSGCLRLDDFLFDPQRIDAYYLNGYEGEVDFELPPSYHLPDSMIHWVPLISDAQGKPVTIQSLYVGDMHSITTDTIILYCHGHRDHLDHYWPRIQLLANSRQGSRYGVMAFDYQGYGLSEGQPGQAAIIRDAVAALAWLEAQGVDHDRIIVYGFSMGSIPAVEIAGSIPLSGRGGLILEAPLSSSETMIQEASTLSLPASFLTDLDFDNVAGMSRISQPMLWLHGETDLTASIRTHGEPVFQAYQGIRAKAVRIPGGGHTDLPVVMGFDAYLDAVHRVLAP
ncbi:MAG: alpha/beta hydrolase [Saprospiraceae bacterium]|nr:alpha/beta hydrolase [Saprospiraceae bacterium]